MATYEPSHLIPTPTATDAQEGVRKSTQQKPGSKHSMGLRDAQRVAQPHLLPTPRAGDSKGGKYQNDRGSKKHPRPTLTGLISSQEAFPASLFPKPAEEEVRKMIATSGLRCYASYENFSPAGSSVKMFVASLLGTTAWYSDKSDLIWKMSATKSSRLLFQLALSAPPTDATASGLLRTPDTGMTRGNLSPENAKRKLKEGTTGNLNNQIRMMELGLIPTPVGNDDNKSPEAHMAMKARMKGGPRHKAASLQVVVKMIPTPNSRDWKGGSAKRGRDNVDSLVEYGTRKSNQAGTKTGLKLQPAFALWMMGYPTDWLDLEDGEMPRSKAQATPSSRK